MKGTDKMDWIVKKNGEVVFRSNTPGAKGEAAIRFANAVTAVKAIGGQAEIGYEAYDDEYFAVLRVAY